MQHKRFVATGKQGLLRRAAILLLLLTVIPEVAFADELTVCTTGPPDCQFVSIQEAVDAASSGDVIKVAAGTYTGVHKRDRSRQVVYIDKTVTIRGGYTAPGYADPPDPGANPTTLDAQGRGRVIYISRYIKPTVEGLRITGGRAAGAGLAGGGGVYVDRASATLSGNQVFANDAVVGGGLFLKGSNAILRDNVISGNTASNGGGVQLDHSPATLLGNIIESNTADQAGGISVSLSAAVLMDNHISGNTADYGGGLVLWRSSATVSRNTVSGNTANEAGGGVQVRESDAILHDNTISENVAHGWGGGGLYVDHAAPMLANSIIADNQAASGSGLLIWDSSPVMLHTTIARNSGGDGRGVYVTGDSSITLFNTILVGHSLGIWVEWGSIASLDATLWANGTDWSGSGIITTANDLWGDPAFVDPVDGDYHISLGSAAIDAGGDAGVYVDIDGQTRPYGADFDIGADEWVPE